MVGRCFEPNSDVKGTGSWLDLFTMQPKYWFPLHDFNWKIIINEGDDSLLGVTSWRQTFTLHIPRTVLFKGKFSLKIISIRHSGTRQGSEVKMSLLLFYPPIITRFITACWHEKHQGHDIELFPSSLQLKYLNCSDDVHSK